jgi:hypothetical protein
MKPNKMFECGRCLNRFEDYDEAVNCCPLQINTVYECPVCEVPSMTIGEAITCCEPKPNRLRKLAS